MSLYPIEPGGAGRPGIPWVAAAALLRVSFPPFLTTYSNVNICIIRTRSRRKQGTRVALYRCASNVVRSCRFESLRWRYIVRAGSRPHLQYYVVSLRKRSLRRSVGRPTTKRLKWRAIGLSSSYPTSGMIELSYKASKEIEYFVKGLEHLGRSEIQCACISNARKLMTRQCVTGALRKSFKTATFTHSSALALPFPFHVMVSSHSVEAMASGAFVL